MLHQRFCGKPRSYLRFTLAALAVLALLLYVPPFCASYRRRNPLTGQIGWSKHAYSSASLKTTKSKFAFATLLSTDSSRSEDQEDLHDEYFIAARMLVYQIIHASDTRSRDIPLIILTTVGVSESKRERLRRDGAIVLAVEPVEKLSWIKAGEARWEKVFDKLRLWELTQFERICFLDSDTNLNRPLDGIFADPAVVLHETLPRGDMTNSDEAPLPATYVFAGQPEMNASHHYPPSVAGHDYLNIEYLNAGFFVIQPSLQLLNHYLSIMRIPGRFNPQTPEQNMLNYAHRSEATGGNMPWKVLDTQWNIHYPTLADLAGGVASMHEKWWMPEHEEMRTHMERLRGRMEGFYEALDQVT